MTGFCRAIGLVLLGFALPSLAGAQATTWSAVGHSPRNVVHADALAWIAGQRLIGSSFERMVTQHGRGSIDIGVASGSGISTDTSDGADVLRISSDLVGIGVAFRHYAGAPKGPRGGYGVVSVAFVGGNSSGYDDRGRQRKYRYLGYEISLPGLGYQVLIANRLCIDASATLRQSLGFLREKNGGDHGVSARTSVVIAGGLGLAF